MTADLNALIAKLESAPEGSRQLSDEVLRELGWTQDTPDYPRLATWYEPDGRCRGLLHAPSLTVSLDDALVLVPEGWGYLIDHMDPDEPEAMVGPHRGIGASPALALCAAILRARGEDGHGR